MSGCNIEAHFERAFCQTVVVFVRLMWHGDCGIRSNSFYRGAFAGLSAIACARGIVGDWSKDFGFVAADNSCRVAHTAIASFHIVSVEQLGIPMVAREVFVYKR